MEWVALAGIVFSAISSNSAARQQASGQVAAAEAAAEAARITADANLEIAYANLAQEWRIYESELARTEQAIEDFRNTREALGVCRFVTQRAKRAQRRAA